MGGLVEGEADDTLLGELDDLGTITARYSRVQYKAFNPAFPRPQLKFSPNEDDEVPKDVGNAKPLLSNGMVSEGNVKGRALSHQNR